MFIENYFTTAMYDPIRGRISFAFMNFYKHLTPSGVDY
jgi:hypothetical protein